MRVNMMVAETVTIPWSLLMVIEATIMAAAIVVLISAATVPLEEHIDNDQILSERNHGCCRARKDVCGGGKFPLG